MATGGLRGTIKEIPSGDTVVIVGTVKGGTGVVQHLRFVLRHRVLQICFYTMRSMMLADIAC